MGVWEDRVVPHLVDASLRSPEVGELRGRVCAGLRGRVLEIGFGTGLNLPHYPRTGITNLTIVDPAELLPTRVQERVAQAPFAVIHARLDAERLPFDDARFDTVVSTWTLCSIPDPVAALREIRRVLRPTGTFHFLEHGLSRRPLVARLQHLWNPIQKVIACGCNVDRPIDHIVAASGLVTTSLERFEIAGELPIMAAMYRGTATR